MNELKSNKELYSIGSKWYALRTGATCLIEVEITDATSATVEIREKPHLQGRQEIKERYCWHGIKFIELIEGPK